MNSRTVLSNLGYRMRKKLLIAYAAISALFFVFFLHAAIVSGLDIRHAAWAEGFQKIEAYDTNIINDTILPVGRKSVFTLQVDRVQDGYNTLMFYSCHQLVNVYVGDKCVYQVAPVRSPLNWKSPGCFWNQLQLEEEYVGKTIRIELIPIYSDMVFEKLDIRYGCNFEILQSIISEDFPVLVFSVISIIVGALYLVIVAVLRQKKYAIDVSGMLGFVYIMVGTWKISNSVCLGIWVKDFPGLSMWSAFLLVLLPIPFCQAVYSMCRQEECWLFKVPCIYSLVNIGVVFFCHLFQVADVRQTVYFTHFGFLLTMATIVTITLKEIRQFGMKDKTTRITVLCVASCLLWVVYELLSFYGKSYTTQLWNLLGMFGFLVHIGLVIARGIRNMKGMMDIGMHARHYEKIAFHDQLTGLYNRTALADFMNQADMTNGEYIIAVFDLNNLKVCNDTYGHEAGDMYIREAATIIRECFGDIGQCYRQGGDEFTAVLTGVDTGLCERRMAEMKEKVAEYNQKSSNIRMGIAGGYAQFDGEQDEDISDTVKRADKRMYEEKFRMKQQMAEEEKL